MTVNKFHKKLKRHCDKLSGNCQRCRFVDYCYSQQRDIHEDFLKEVIKSLSKNEDENTGKFSPVIQNRYNFLSDEVSNLKI